MEVNFSQELASVNEDEKHETVERVYINSSQRKSPNLMIYNKKRTTTDESISVKSPKLNGNSLITESNKSKTLKLKLSRNEDDLMVTKNINQKDLYLSPNIYSGPRENSPFKFVSTTNSFA
jgi:hypothetical protein